MCLAGRVGRFALLGAVLCVYALGWGGPATLAASQVSKELHEAEEQFENAAHADPDTLPSSADPLSIDPDLAIWTLIVFAILLAFLWKFAWGPILAALEKREESIAHNIAEAKREHGEAKDLLAEYERKLAAAADEVRGIMEQARREAEQAKQAIVAEAKAAADQEKQRGLREIAEATDAAEQRLAERSAELAVGLASKIVGQSLSAKDHTRLIQEAVDKFPSAASNN